MLSHRSIGVRSKPVYHGANGICERGLGLAQELLGLLTRLLGPRALGGSAQLCLGVRSVRLPAFAHLRAPATDLHEKFGLDVFVLDAVESLENRRSAGKKSLPLQVFAGMLQRL